MFNKNNQSYKKFKPLKILFFILVFAGFIILVPYIVMLLWNAILPDVTGVKPLNFWQAAGLVLLTKILFGGFGGRRGGWKNSKKHNWKTKWMNMSHDERHEAKNRWKEYCKNRETDREI